MVTYDKNKVIKKGRFLHSRGPRDHQRRLENNTNNIIPSDFSTYTKEQIDDILNKVLEESSLELEKKYIVEINSLKEIILDKKNELINSNKMISELNQKLDKKDLLIADLTNKIVKGAVMVASKDHTQSEQVDDRPSMEQVFIDPTKKGAENDFKSHIVTKEEVSTKQPIAFNINKLKALMGNKLPKN